MSIIIIIIIIIIIVVVFIIMRSSSNKFAMHPSLRRERTKVRYETKTTMQS